MAPFLSCIAAALLGLQEGPPGEITKLIARLGSPAIGERDAASQDLKKLGRIAAPALGAALGSEDCEVASRRAIS